MTRTGYLQTCLNMDETTNHIQCNSKNPTVTIFIHIQLEF